MPPSRKRRRTNMDPGMWIVTNSDEITSVSDSSDSRDASSNNLSADTAASTNAAEETATVPHLFCPNVPNNQATGSRTVTSTDSTASNRNSASSSLPSTDSSSCTTSSSTTQGTGRKSRKRTRSSRSNQESRASSSNTAPATMTSSSAASKGGVATQQAAPVFQSHVDIVLQNEITSSLATIGLQNNDTPTAAEVIRLLRERVLILEEIHDNDKTCKICMDNPVNACFVPCGHTTCSCCSSSSQIMLLGDSEDEVDDGVFITGMVRRGCPFCFKKVKAVQRMFYA